MAQQFMSQCIGQEMSRGCDKMTIEHCPGHQVRISSLPKFDLRQQDACTKRKPSPLVGFQGGNRAHHTIAAAQTARSGQMVISFHCNQKIYVHIASWIPPERQLERNAGIWLNSECPAHLCHRCRSSAMPAAPAEAHRNLHVKHAVSMQSSWSNRRGAI